MKKAKQLLLVISGGALLAALLFMAVSSRALNPQESSWAFVFFSAFGRVFLIEIPRSMAKNTPGQG